MGRRTPGRQLSGVAAVPAGVDTMWGKSFLAAVTALVLLSAGVGHAATQRILYVGDSWTAYPWAQDPPALRTVLQRPEVGLGQYEENGAIVLYQATAAGWDAPDPLNQIALQIAANPTIDIIHLSLGGNDINLTWKASFTPEQTTALINQTLGHIENVVNFCLNLRPDIRVSICGYDYLNISEGFSFGSFTEVTGVEDPTLLAYALFELPAPLLAQDVLANQARGEQCFHRARARQARSHEWPPAPRLCPQPRPHAIRLRHPRPWHRRGHGPLS
jgi:hypothetical protein